MGTLRVVLRAALISICLTTTALSDIWTVDDDSMADFDNIQEAVDAASNGDEIIVMPGIYTGTGDQVVDTLGKEIWLHSYCYEPIRSNTRLVAYIDAEGARRGIHCHSNETSNTIIEGFTIANGYAATGGGMYSYNSSPMIINCIFSGNTAENGGGMSNTFNSNPTMTNCTFISNTANYGGGMESYESSPSLTNCTFVGNTANYGGGVNNWQSNLTLMSCSFTSNNANNGGGGIYNNPKSTLTLTYTTLCGNMPDQIYGDWNDNGNNTISEECSIGCPDLNGDGIVNVSDLLNIIEQWGLINSYADVNLDGAVDVSDLLIVISNWGPCE